MDRYGDQSPSLESQILLGCGYACSCFSCVGCGPSSSCNALRRLRKRRMVLLLLPWLRLLLVLQCLTFSASPASRSMIARFMLGGFSAPRAPQDGPRAILSYFFGFQEPPRALQEALKRLSEDFRVEDTIRTPFSTYFWLQKVSLGPQQPRKNIRKTTVFEDLTILA